MRWQGTGDQQIYKSDMEQNQRVWFNKNSGSLTNVPDTSSVQGFHKQLPGYAPTPLIPLNDIAKQLQVGSVFLKDESSRLGLPAFKILGASWGTLCAITSQLSLPKSSSLDTVGLAARKHCIVLFGATEGNHGRAVAAMARMLGLEAHIYVPSTVNEATIDLIASEGAKVSVTQSHYDDAVREAFAASKMAKGGILIQDNAFEEYEQIPSWIVEGYSTLLVETYAQLAERGLRPTLVICPVGVGSLAHAVVSYCKSYGRQENVMTVEPEAAPCLHESLKAGRLVSVYTSPTIMDGMNCQTVSSTAFRDLQACVDISILVSDPEVHDSIQVLSQEGIKSGPCGAAPLAALWRISKMIPRHPSLSEDVVIVLLSTEGTREYDLQCKVTIDDGPK